MLVQIYEIGDPEEARAVAALGVDHVGVLVGNGDFPRERRPQAARAIFAALPARVKRVALSLSSDPAAIARVIEETAPDIIHAGAAAERFGPEASAELKRRYPGVKLMRSIPVTDDSSIAFAKAQEGIADFLLLDSHAPGDAQIGALGRTHDWRISRRIAASVAVPAILAGGLGPDNVADAIRAVAPAGVDSKTKTDRADGSHAKDVAKVRAFVQAAKAVAR
jgi:phosphoribosylanthranilate isomerase